MQMNRQEILEKLKEILLSADSKNASVLATCTEDSRLFTDLGLTSIGMLYLVIAIEESFSIRFENVGVNDFVTIKDVVDYIVGRQS